MKIKNLRPLDIITLSYIALNLLLFLVGWKRIIRPHVHFPIFLGIGIFILFLCKLDDIKPSKSVKIMRDWFPLFLFVYFFEATSNVKHILFSNFLDHFFQQIDEWMFGYQPALVWGKVLDNYFWQELFHFAYFAYYLIPFLFVFLYLHDKKIFAKFAFTVSFVFYVCYLTYNFLPVIGGRWWEIMEGAEQLTTQYRYGPFTRIMAYIYRTTVHQGGAFPSSHVAVSIVANIIAFEYKKILGWIFLPITILLTISTVHCHYHYFIDTIFGVFYGFGFYYLGLKLYSYLQKKNG
jgi:membrane-associated phospholipid phosphatase